MLLQMTGSMPQKSVLSMPLTKTGRYLQIDSQGTPSPSPSSDEVPQLCR
jgi:hypothetical protein